MGSGKTEVSALTLRSWTVTKAAHPLDGTRPEGKLEGPWTTATGGSTTVRGQTHGATPAERPTGKTEPSNTVTTCDTEDTVLGVIASPKRPHDTAWLYSCVVPVAVNSQRQEVGWRSKGLGNGGS
jgi:hypothetical protein